MSIHITGDVEDDTMAWATNYTKTISPFTQLVITKCPPYTVELDDVGTTPHYLVETPPESPQDNINHKTAGEYNRTRKELGRVGGRDCKQENESDRAG